MPTIPELENLGQEGYELNKYSKVNRKILMKLQPYQKTTGN